MSIYIYIYIYIQRTPSMKRDGKGGETYFDFENNRVVIDVYNVIGGDHTVNEVARTAHELTHGGQFVVGDIDFAETHDGQNAGGNSFDFNDELEACENENLFLDEKQSEDGVYKSAKRTVWKINKWRF